MPANSNDVLLVFPGKYKAPDPQIPLMLLNIASVLRQEGFSPRILDMRVDDYLKADIGNPLFIGITCMSGQQINYALKIARRVRAERYSCLIVWGGIHPTLLPEQTIADEHVDLVVRGEGELIVGELAHKLALDEPLDTIKGITYKNPDGTIISTPDAEVIDLDIIPLELPYDLLKLDKYPSLQAGRFHIQTSRGCPHRCGFCYNTKFNRRKWRGKTAKRVVEEIKFIIKKYPFVKIIDPIDDNFFVDQNRVRDICNGILENDIKVSWRANCRFDYLCTYDKDFLQLLEKAGCIELDFGGESGSPALQQFVCKDVTADQILDAVGKLRIWAPSIEPYTSWLSGLPFETYADMEQTFDLMDKMKEANPRTQHYGIFIYTPYPSPMLASLGTYFEPPQSLEAWGNIEVFHFEPPWHSKQYINKLRAIAAVTRYNFYPYSRINEHGSSFKITYKIINHLARFRWKHRYFGFPVELKLANAFARKLRGFL